MGGAVRHLLQDPYRFYVDLDRAQEISLDLADDFESYDGLGASDFAQVFAIQ